MSGKQRHAPSLVLERISRARAEGEKIIVVGIDEVGTGALAGPIITAAVGFEDDELTFSSKIRDSKILTSEKRKTLFPEIIKSAIVVGIGSATPNEIDTLGAAEAHRRALIRAFRAAKKRYTGDKRLVCVVDGRKWHTLRNILGGPAAIFADRADQKSFSVAAASIIAKVTRDDIMDKCAPLFPEYGFERNVGYGTKHHLTALKKYGPSIIHRLSTAPIKRILRDKNAEKETNTTSEENIGT